MSNSPRHICLQKAIKEGLRRCVYRRWEAEVKGRALITKITNLERMYRGNTPYPLGHPSIHQKTYPNTVTAQVALRQAISRRRRLGYSGK
jgi:hypothetical protein